MNDKKLGVAIFQTARGWVFILHESGKPVIDDFIVTSGMRKTLQGAIERARLIGGDNIEYFHRIDNVILP